MKKTVLCHFYNEEWLLPFWLKHHREYFDHGIMIDYCSTDRSVEIIKELCPTWDIINSKNRYFLTTQIDREVESIEKNLTGWRVCLNVPEFLVGNYDRLCSTSALTNIYVGQYMFVEQGDMLTPTMFNPLQSLITQCSYGISGKVQSPRLARSIHNYPILYPDGRHFSNLPTYDDLTIFYYGWASLCEESIARKLQIQTKFFAIQDPLSPHLITRKDLPEKIQEYKKISIDLTEEIKRYL
jgi:hypothetical protein